MPVCPLTALSSIWYINRCSSNSFPLTELMKDKNISLEIHLFSYLLSTYFVPGIALDQKIKR